jgi:formylmethanofuran dehydrogenase subunit C
MITLTLKQSPAVPLEAEALTPDVLATLSHDAIRALPVLLGKRRHRLDDFFDVEGAASDEIELRGDLTKVKWIAREMSRGRVTVVGNAGMHLGAFMKGGTVTVTGNASDWLGAEMSGGVIRVRGSAGGQVGAAYRGSVTGMTEGTILIEGAAGIELGMRMKRGVIAVGGPVRDFAGLEMKGGTIFLLGGAEIRTGAWMARGTIVSLVPIKLLPTFTFACSYQPSFLGLYAKHLRALGFAIPPLGGDGAFDRYLGDTSALGKGEILVWHPPSARRPSG